MTVSMNDLSVVKSYTDEVDKTEWRHVEYNGKRFILTATNVTDDVIDHMMDTTPYIGVLYAIGGLPAVDTAVFRGDEDWNIIGECDDSCADGMCSKRLASSHDFGNIEHSFAMLLNYLNS